MQEIKISVDTTDLDKASKKIDKIKKSYQELLEFMKELDQFHEKSEKVNFIIGETYRSNCCDGCFNNKPGTVCCCSLPYMTQIHYVVY